MTGIAFFVGILWVQQWAVLPAAKWCLAAAIPLLCGYHYLRAHPWLRWLWAGMLGICWAVAWGQSRLYTALPENLAGQDIAISGFIASIPDLHERGFRFDVAVDEYAGMEDAVAARLPRKLRLSWYGSADGRQPAPMSMPVPGEYWRLTVRLKPAHGFINPGTFDYEAWLFGSGIRATGYVRASADNKRIRQAGGEFVLQALRQEILSRIRTLTAAGDDTARNYSAQNYTGLVAALAIGYQSDISREQWQLLADTGTTHLISISGLHISMVAGLCYLLAFWLHGLLLLPPLARRYPLWPAQRTAALAGISSALFYSALAGFSLPTVRSLLMLTVVFCALFYYRQLRPWQALLTALLLVLVIDPFAVNSASFWLSFGAVAILIYLLSARFRAHPHAGRQGWRRRLYRWTFVQVALVPALIPLTLFWFGRSAMLAAAANFIAIPWISCIVVPLILLGTAAAFVSDAVAAALFACAVLLLQWLWQLLQWLSQLPYGQWAQHPPRPEILLLAMLGVGWLLAPRGVPARWAGVACLLPLFWHYPRAPAAEGDVWLSVLDVGQGTAVVVRTFRHVLLYDAGPRFSENFDTGTAVVVPYLRGQGVKSLDMLIVSHSDNDHQGGAESVLREIPAARVLAGEPGRYPAGLQPARQCMAGQRWQWDGVSFEILAPAPAAAMNGNNASCVLSIVAPGGRILLPGDIEREVEQQLWAAGRLAPVDILLLPHHGSRSSSTELFVAAVRPRYAVATADYRNRYGFPKADVVGRYRDIGATVLATGQSGAIQFRLDHALGLEAPVLQRHADKRYWRHMPPPEG
jgi:competence protein ComEC